MPGPATTITLYQAQAIAELQFAKATEAEITQYGDGVLNVQIEGNIYLIDKEGVIA